MNSSVAQLSPACINVNHNLIKVSAVSKDQFSPVPCSKLLDVKSELAEEDTKKVIK